MNSIFSRRVVRIKAMQHLYAYYLHKNVASQALEDKEKSAEGLFEKEVHQIQKNIYAILDLLIQWQQVAIIDDQEVRNRLKSRILDNQDIKLITTTAFYQEFLKKYGRYWEYETAQLIYYQSIKPKKKFCKTKLPSASEESKDLIETLVKKIFFKEDSIQREMATRDRNWSENKLIAKSFFSSFLKKWLKNRDEGSHLLSFPASLEENLFFVTLIQKTKQECDRYTHWIKQNTHNWDLNRITLLDQVLVQLALTEILYLQEIDPSISINEYLEIAKTYSTSKSHIFIHGLLDSFIKNTSKKWDSVD
ncbi:MAG: transcription antitermination protein NusB [Bacteroidota bacterium]